MKKIKMLFCSLVIVLTIFLSISNVFAVTDTELLNLYVEKFKNTEFLNSLKGEDEELDVITTTDTIKFIIKTEEEEATVNYTYNNGILSFVPSNDSDLYFTEVLSHVNAIYALGDLKEYETEKLEDYINSIEDPNVLTLEDDGIEFKTEEYIEEETVDGVTSTSTIDKVTSFKLDLRNGFKKLNTNQSEAGDENVNQDSTVEKEEQPEEDKPEEFKPEENNVENPKTGVVLSYGILMLILIISSIVYFLIRKKSKFLRHN